MADVQITKIIMLRGLSADLPQALDPGEPGFSLDEGRMFVGCEPTVGQPQYNRTSFPYRNIEVLTENSNELFAKMHGDRMKEGGGHDYYRARLDPDRFSWTTVKVARDDETLDYRIANTVSVSAFIDYSIADFDGKPIRMGNMRVTHYADFEGEPHLADNAMVRRDLTLTDGANYDPAQVYGAVAFRFKVEGPVNAQYLVFQYKNVTPTVLNLRFKVSRPEPVFYDPTPVQPQEIPLDPLGRIKTNVVIGSNIASRTFKNVSGQVSASIRFTSQILSGVSQTFFLDLGDGSTLDIGEGSLLY
jgi:hypothetical protein